MLHFKYYLEMQTEFYVQYDAVKFTPLVFNRPSRQLSSVEAAAPGGQVFCDYDMTSSSHLIAVNSSNLLLNKLRAAVAYFNSCSVSVRLYYF